MRFLHTIHSANREGGGVIEAVRQLAAALAPAGHTTEIVSLDDPADPWVQECPVKVHALGPGRSGYGYSAAFRPWLKEHGREFDAVIVNGLWQYHGFGAWLALRGTKTPYFVFPHGMLDPWFKRTYPLKHLKKWAYWPWADYRLLRDAKAVLFTADEERRLARESFWLYRCNEAVANLGIAAPPGEPDAQIQSVLEKFPGLRGKRVMLFLGRIHPKKGCDLLLNAFAEVCAADPEWQLVVAGPDSTGWTRELQAIAERRKISAQVLWAGMLSGDLKWGMLRLAEAFVLPSHQENFGIAVAEALACGTPVLISDKVNIWREIEQDRAGFVATDDESGTIRLLRQWNELLPEDRVRMRNQATQTFQQRFEITRAAESFVRVITPFVSGKGA